ncbi:MAG: trehalose-phosphatase [Candidatus Margulisbacteria bacterium]|nr:trehalose-phosphatase [Candidatus Margulisiibacteriota bacterium]
MKTALFLDYDGTLTPIVDHPDRARLGAVRKRFLRTLAQRPVVKIAIVSGRSLASVRKQVGLPGLIYIGNHGLEIMLGKRRVVVPAARRFAKTVRELKTVLHRGLPFPGVLIEDKGYTISVHYRKVHRRHLKSFRQAFFRAIAPWRKRIRVTAGKKVLELRPPGLWGKGRAVKWLLRQPQLRGYQPVYIGDDRTDEDAFRALRQRGLTLRVGLTSATAAQKCLPGISGVYRYLERYRQP